MSSFNNHQKEGALPKEATLAVWAVMSFTSFMSTLLLVAIWGTIRDRPDVSSTSIWLAEVAAKVSSAAFLLCVLLFLASAVVHIQENKVSSSSKGGR